MLAGLITALVAVVSDQASKALVFGFLAETQPVVAVTPFFNLVSAWNTGVSFSMFDNLGGAGVYILSAFSLVVVGFLLLLILCGGNSQNHTEKRIHRGNGADNLLTVWQAPDARQRKIQRPHRGQQQLRHPFQHVIRLVTHAHSSPIAVYAEIRRLCRFFSQKA